MDHFASFSLFSPFNFGDQIGIILSMKMPIIGLEPARGAPGCRSHCLVNCASSRAHI